MSPMRDERQTREDSATQPLDAGRLSFAITNYLNIEQIQANNVQNKKRIKRKQAFYPDIDNIKVKFFIGKQNVCSLRQLFAPLLSANVMSEG